MPPPSQAAAEQPVWGKVIPAALGGGAVAAIFYVLLEFGRTERAKLILLAGLIAVAVLLLLYKLLLGWLRRRKAAPMTRSILANSSAAPHGISDPAKRAKLDEMRKSFEAGVSKFRAAGKDLYTLPWFVLVGEPGGGKTEAIRHSQVGFPHGLQDYMQGAGGTVNMNWWFTNHAIILDTAGRLMFEEVAPGATNEWNEFLQMLRQHRPNCPINGMVLVIPADSLIKDSVEAIERKAGKIAQQLDLIQRTLEVRFPVFVAVSKCDLISGFREFFETVDDPQLQGQILGWSNPMSLDQPFNPELVDEHLETVRSRLAARRYGLLLDPVHTEDPEARRIDQVDALYTFPDSLQRIGPRLRRYLETIFVAGEWSPKPLFLRGIYFTSSMREGAALDAELADVLKVPVDSLRDEGRIWERNKTYFLREPFLKKVFVEKGLVTRAARPNRLHRTRKVAVLATGFVAIATLFGLTAVGVRDFKRKLGNESEYWPAVQKNYASWAIVDDNNNYAGEDPAGGMPRESAPRLGEFFADARDRVTRNIEVPRAFAGPNLVLDQFSPAKRKSAYRAVYETSVVRPLVTQARRKLGDAKAWQRGAPEASAALRELVRLEAEARVAENNPDRPAWQPRVDLEPLFKFVLSPSQYEQYAQQQDKLKQRGRDNLASAADWLYSDERDTGRPPTWLGFTQPESRRAVADGLKQFNDYWLAQVSQSDDWFQGVGSLRQALANYQAAVDAADKDLAAVRAVATTDDYTAFRNRLNGQVTALGAARQAVESAGKGLRPGESGQSIGKEYTARVRQLEQRAVQAYDELRQAAVPDPGLSKLVGAPPKRPPDPETSPDRLNELDDQLRPPQVAALAGLPRYAAQEQVYQFALADLDGAQGAKPPGGDAEQLNAVFGEAQSRADARLLEVAQLDKQAQDERLSVKQPVATWRLAAQSAAAKRRRDAIAAVLDAFRGGTPEERVKGLTKTPLAHPVTVPFTSINRERAFRADYDPAGARSLVSTVKNLRPHLPADADLQAESASSAPGAARQPGPKQRVLDFDALRTRYNELRSGTGEYLLRYAAYWKDQVPALAALDPRQLQRWDDFFDGPNGEPRRWSADAVNSDFEKVVDQIRDALAVAEDSGEQKAQAAARQGAAQCDQITQRLNAGPFQIACNRVIENWKLSRDPAATRRTILDLTPADFKIDYLFDDDTGGFVSKYWSALSNQLLQLLVNRCAESADKEYRDALAKYDGFPLVLHGQKQLDVKAVDAARQAVEKLLGGRWPGEASAQPKAPLRSAELPADFPNRQLLARLVMPVGNPARFKTLKKVFDALSPDAPAKCTVSLMDAATRARRQVPGRRLPDQRWSDIRVSQAGRSDRTLRVAPQQNGKELVLGGFDCRVDAPIVIEMAERAQAAAQQNWQTWEFRSPCPALRTVAAEKNAAAAPKRAVVAQALPRAAKSEAGEQVWDVEVLVADNNQVAYSLWLTVSFDKDLPPLNEWSQPLGQ